MNSLILIGIEIKINVKLNTKRVEAPTNENRTNAQINFLKVRLLF